MHNMMAVCLWVTCYLLIMIFSNKTFFVRKFLKVKVLEIFQNKHDICWGFGATSCDAALRYYVIVNMLLLRY